MQSLPDSPAALLDRLGSIFPGFATPVDSELGESLTMHSVMSDFAVYFVAHIDSFSDRQLLTFARLVTAAGLQKGTLENAIDTCFLEHTRQLRVNRQLAPWLTKARREAHAP